MVKSDWWLCNLYFSHSYLDCVQLLENRGKHALYLLYCVNGLRRSDYVGVAAADNVVKGN